MCTLKHINMQCTHNIPQWLQWLMTCDHPWWARIACKCVLYLYTHFGWGLRASTICSSSVLLFRRRTSGSAVYLYIRLSEDKVPQLAVHHSLQLQHVVLRNMHRRGQQQTHKTHRHTQTSTHTRYRQNAYTWYTVCKPVTFLKVSWEASLRKDPTRSVTTVCLARTSSLLKLWCTQTYIN